MTQTRFNVHGDNSFFITGSPIFENFVLLDFTTSSQTYFVHG